MEGSESAPSNTECAMDLGVFEREFTKSRPKSLSEKPWECLPDDTMALSC